MQQPRIFTERLMLRSLELEDASPIAALAGAREIAATTLRIPHPYDQSMAEQWITGLEQQRIEGRSACFAVCVQEGRQLIGCIGLELERDQGRAELGYWIGHSYWGRGYATEAAAAVLEFAFDMLHLRRVFASHFAENEASGRVLAKIGMKHEGRLREHIEKWGEYHDSVVWGIVESDYVELVSQRVARSGGGCCAGHE